MTDLPHSKVAGKNGETGFELAAEALNDTQDVLAFLRTRRSVVAADIIAPGPDERQLSHIMEAAVRVPDHGKLTPWRFIILQDDAKAAYAALLRRLWLADNPSAAQDAPVPEADFAVRAPLVITVVSSPREHPKIPVQEQLLSAGAVCMALVNAALACGFAAQWRTGWPATDERVLHKLGLAAHESIAGFVFIGSRRPDAPPLTDRRRPFWQHLTSRLDATAFHEDE